MKVRKRARRRKASRAESRVSWSTQGKGSPCKEKRHRVGSVIWAHKVFATAKKKIQSHFSCNKHSPHFQLIQQEHVQPKWRKEKWKWKSLSRVWLFATLWTVYGILQARILELVAFPFSRGSSQLKVHSCIHRRKQPSRGPGISTITNFGLERSLPNHLILLPF